MNYCFDFSYLSRNKDSVAIRAGLISATQILIQRAALELDIAPEEFEQIEPKLIDNVPVLQICDQLANGAGFSQKLSESSESSGIPQVLDLIRSILSDSNDLLSIKLRADEHKASCLGACYKCIQRYGNRNYHGLLDWRLGLSYLRLLYDPNYKCGLDGNFNFIELESWHKQVQESLMNVKMLKPSVYALPEFKEINGLKLGVIHNKKIGKKYYVIHPFWSKKYVKELLGVDSNSDEIEFLNSFEILHTPQDIF